MDNYTDKDIEEIETRVTTLAVQVVKLGAALMKQIEAVESLCDLNRKSIKAITEEGNSHG